MNHLDANAAAIDANCLCLCLCVYIFHLISFFFHQSSFFLFVYTHISLSTLISIVHLEMYHTNTITQPQLDIIKHKCYLCHTCARQLTFNQNICIELNNNNQVDDVHLDVWWSKLITWYNIDVSLSTPHPVISEKMRPIHALYSKHQVVIFRLFHCQTLVSIFSPTCWHTFSRINNKIW